VEAHSVSLSRLLRLGLSVSLLPKQAHDNNAAVYLSYPVLRLLAYKPPSRLPRCHPLPENVEVSVDHLLLFFAEVFGAI
jgi:hypothetical protein